MRYSPRIWKSFSPPSEQEEEEEEEEEEEGGEGFEELILKVEVGIIYLFNYLLQDMMM